MNIKYMGEQAVSYLIEKCKATFALITHTHTASDVGADEAGSASAALSLAEEYTNEQIASVEGLIENKADKSALNDEIARATAAEEANAAAIASFVEATEEEIVSLFASSEA